MPLLRFALVLSLVLSGAPAAVAVATVDGVEPAGVAGPTTVPVPDRFAGTVEEFYVVPEPLPPGEPGELIRVQDISAGGGRVTVRIMYHSRDTLGRDRAVTGTLTYPTATAPPGGWPVVSLAHGTTGLAAPCAPSRGGGSAPTFGLEAVGVATDYIGLGPQGEIHPYLSRLSEGHSVIDAVRAARNLTEAGAGTRWLTVGASQGGHGALSASELGETYAPELELLGAVSLAPAAMFDRTYGPLDEVVTQVVGVMMLYGAAAEHPDVDFDDYASDQVSAVAAEVMTTRCLPDIIAAMAPIPAADFYDVDPRSTEPTRSLLAANDVGTVAVDSPVLLVQGTADALVALGRTRDLFERMCASGQVTEYTEYPDATHDDIGARASVQITDWLEARLAGLPPTDTCATGVPVTTVAPAWTTTSTGPTAAPVIAAVTPVAVTATPRFAG